MTRNDERRDVDEQSIARAFRDRMRGLDAFIPPVPPFSQIEHGTQLLAAGSRASGGRVRPGRAAPVALLLAAVVVVLAVAVVWVPRTTGPAASSPSSTPTATPLLSPSTRTPASTPTLPWQIIYRDYAAGIAWSPAGTMLAFSDNNDQSEVHILGVDGQQLGTLPGDAVAWLDETSLVVLQADGEAYVDHLGDGTRSPIAGQFEDLIGGSGGDVALLLKEQASDGYRIWSRSSGLSARRDGQPLAFSPDGSKLAVVHYPESCCAGALPTAAPAPPTLDVTEVATGKSLVTDSKIHRSGVQGYLVSFSPNSRQIAFLRDAMNTLAEVGVLDIDSANLWVVGPGPSDLTSPEPDGLFWRGGGHLEILTWTSGAIPSDMPFVVSFGGDAIYAAATSSNGYVATIANARNADGGLGGSTSIAVTGGGSTRQLDLPATAWGLYWSPSGSMLVVVCGPPDGAGGDWELVLVRM